MTGMAWRWLDGVCGMMFVEWCSWEGVAVVTVFMRHPDDGTKVVVASGHQRERKVGSVRVWGAEGKEEAGLAGGGQYIVEACSPSRKF
jgi:hypothetical protein